MPGQRLVWLIVSAAFMPLLLFVLGFNRLFYSHRGVNEGKKVGSVIIK